MSQLEFNSPVRCPSRQSFIGRVGRDALTVRIALVSMGMALAVLAAGFAPQESRASDSAGLYGQCKDFERLIERESGELLALVGFGQCDGEKGEPVLVQFESDGNVDQSFGSGGFVYLPDSQPAVDLFLRHDGAAILVQPNQVSAFDDSGNPLAAFGTGGSVSVQDAFQDAPYPVTSAALQSDGKVLLSGITGSGEPLPRSPVVMRVNLNGEADASFGTGGTEIVELPQPSGAGEPVWSSAGLVASADDGRIYLASWFSSGEPLSYMDPEWATTVIKLEPDGSVDDTYGTDGTGLSSLLDEASDLSWDPGRLVVGSDGAVHLTATVSGLISKPYLVVRRYYFDPGGSIQRRYPGHSKPSSFTTEFDALVTGSYDGPYSDDYPFPFLYFAKTIFDPDISEIEYPEAVAELKMLIGSARSRSGVAIESAAGGYLVGGTADAEQCLSGSSIRGCRASLVLAKINESGSLVEGFGVSSGLTTVPGIYCPLGASSDETLGILSRLRCRRQLPGFTTDASIGKGRSASPKLRIIVENFETDTTADFPGGKLKIRLPKAFGARRGIARRGTSVKVRKPDWCSDTYSHCGSNKASTSFSGGSLYVELRNTNSVQPAKVVLKVKRGYLRRVPRRKWGQKLSFGIGVSSLSDRYEGSEGVLEYIRSQKTSAKVKKPRRAGRQ